MHCRGMETVSLMELWLGRLCYTLDSGAQLIVFRGYGSGLTGENAQGYLGEESKRASIPDQLINNVLRALQIIDFLENGQSCTKIEQA